MTDGHGIPKRRDADRSRSAILDAAEELFAHAGFEAVTMAQIGAAAGVSRGTPGYFYGSKESLYAAVVRRAEATLQMLVETLRVRDAAGRRDATARMSDAVYTFLTLLVGRRSLVRLIDRHGQSPDAPADAPHARALRLAFGEAGDELDRGALVALSLCWFPLSHPDAARALGVDPDAPGFVAEWHTHVMATLTRATRPDEPGEPAPRPVGAAPTWVASQRASSDPQPDSESPDPQPEADPPAQTAAASAVAASQVAPSGRSAETEREAEPTAAPQVAVGTVPPSRVSPLSRPVDPEPEIEPPATPYGVSGGLARPGVSPPSRPPDPGGVAPPSGRSPYPGPGPVRPADPEPEAVGPDLTTVSSADAPKSGSVPPDPPSANESAIRDGKGKKQKKGKKKKKKRDG